MPRVKVPEEAVWKEFELETKLIQPPVLKLKIKPTFQKELIVSLLRALDIKSKEGISSREMVEAFKEMAEQAKKLVVGWDLVDENDQPIECNQEAKEKWLDPLLWEEVKKIEEENEEEKGLKWLWSQIIKFASNLSNFTKN